MSEILDIDDHDDFALRSAWEMADRGYLQGMDVHLVADILRAVVTGVREVLEDDELAGRLETVRSVAV